MAFRAQKTLMITRNSIKCLVRYKSQRRNLGKSPGEARTLEQRLQELHFRDPELHYKVNIGFALKTFQNEEVSSEHGKLLKKNRSNTELEKLSRINKLLIPLDSVESEWRKMMAPIHLKTIAEHYSVFEHLFGDAYFYPVVSMNIDYKKEDRLIASYWGNVLKPEQASSTPNVSFESKPESLWTLVMSTPDGHLSSENLEYCHWFVGNIRGDNVKDGEVVLDYMQPLPIQGLGYLRYIFVLYKQEERLDYSDLKRTFSKDSLEKRSFSTYKFYQERQKTLTPAGLSFFTADWDQSVTDYFNNILNYECPRFVYDFPEHFYKKQTWFPLKQPFNLYLDRYRDEKEIAKEYLLKKLKYVDPFKEPPKPLMYPNAVPFKPGTPSWLKNEIIKERLGLARAKDYL